MGKFGYGNSTDAGSPYLASRGAEQIWQSMNTLRVPNIRVESDLSPIDSEPEYIWQDDAACAFFPPSMFELADSDSQIAEGMAEHEIKDLNSTNFEAAKKVCDRCPVWHLCYQEAQPSDFGTTMRAGIIPLRHTPVPRGRPATVRAPQPGVRGKPDPTKPCGRDHDIESWRKRADSINSWYCKDCKREDARAKGGVASTKVAKIDPSQPCRHGHGPDWGSNNKGYLFCRECERVRNRNRRRAWDA